MIEVGPHYDVPHDVPRVALCVIATGRYQEYLETLIHSAKRFFLPSCLVCYVVFSDRQPLWELAHAWCRVDDRPWPAPTLLRYHWMLQAEMFLRRYEFVYYCDADMEFVDCVRGEVLGNLVVVAHQGYVGAKPSAVPYERNGRSRACVRRDEGTTYYAGGFQGGRFFLPAMRSLRKAIDEDREAGIIAVWHDESHWNRYLIDHQPDVVLPPDYCCCETKRSETTKVVALMKDHAAMREK